MTNDWHAAVLRFVCKGEERFPRHLVVNLNKVGTLLLKSGDHGACVGGISNVHGTDSSLVRKSSASMLNAGSIDKGTGDSYDSRPTSAPVARSCCQRCISDNDIHAPVSRTPVTPLARNREKCVSRRSGASG